MSLTANDRSEILQLAGRYAHAIDNNDAEGWADCCTADGAFESEVQGRFAGRAELIRFSKTAEKFGRQMEVQPMQKTIVVLPNFSLQSILLQEVCEPWTWPRT